MILRTPIISEGYSPDESALSDAKPAGNMLGYVALELDLKSVRLQQYKEIFISSLMILFCIGIALIFGWRLMRDVTGPIRNMVNTVDRIRRGQLDSRVEGFMLGELDMLKNGINSMAMSLAAYHEEMQHNIDQSTRICAKPWSRWRSRTLSWIWRKSVPRKRHVLNRSFWPICRTSCARRSTGLSVSPA
jgi:two-component system sensor histidine kinase BarA